MTRIPRVIAATSLLAVLAVPLAACSDSKESTKGAGAGGSGPPNPSLCGDIANLGNDVDALQSLAGQPATGGQLKQVQASIGSDLQAASDKAQGTLKAELGAVQTAFNSLNQAVAALPDSIESSAALNIITPQVNSLNAAVDRFQAQASCPGATASPGAD